DEHLPDPAALQRVFRAAQVSGDSGGDDLVAPADAPAIHALVRAKLEVEPVEDLRIDFEDGFTQRDVPAGRRDRDEDEHVDRILAEL
ncbi:UNVERIFIED_CONTAM: aldolase, partial [Bacteroidetes bacterium 56_B9]